MAPPSVTCHVLRILSDLHYSDSASRVRALDSLRPLFAGADALVFNGDSVETRRTRHPEKTAAQRAEFFAFLRRHAPPCVFLTGNHDPDISPHHWLDLAGGQVFVTHGDILFDAIGPWGSDAPALRAALRVELAALSPAERGQLAPLFAACKRVSARRSPPHDPHAGGLRHHARRFAEKLRPSLAWGMLNSWLTLPRRAEAFLRRHRPDARFIVVGHTHRPGVWRRSGVVIINTGSFCPPLGRCAVDLTRDSLTVRAIRSRRGVFHLGPVTARFALAPAELEIEPSAVTLFPS